MTPGNIAGMAVLNGLQIVALTDHNTSKNCPAFFEACKAYGLIPIAGMELTTAEDIHVVCLFRDLESAMDFDAYVDTRRLKIKNKPAVFGNQLIVDSEDEIVGEEEHLLINATDITLEEAHRLVTDRSGVCYPAHIDRQSNGMIAMLGDFPPEPRFTAYELNAIDSLADCRAKYPIITARALTHLASSDAHRLTDIAEPGFAMEIEDEPYSSALVRNRLIDRLLGLGG